MRLTTRSVGVVSRAKSVAVTEYWCKTFRHFDEIPQVASGSLQANLTAPPPRPPLKKKKKEKKKQKKT